MKLIKNKEDLNNLELNKPLLIQCPTTGIIHRMVIKERGRFYVRSCGSSARSPFLFLHDNNHNYKWGSMREIKNVIQSKEFSIHF